jgi:hypothetical protein
MVRSTFLSASVCSLLLACGAALPNNGGDLSGEFRGNISGSGNCSRNVTDSKVVMVRQPDGKYLLSGPDFYYVCEPLVLTFNGTSGQTETPLTCDQYIYTANATLSDDAQTLNLTVKVAGGTCQNSTMLGVMTKVRRDAGM